MRGHVRLQVDRRSGRSTPGARQLGQALQTTLIAGGLVLALAVGGAVRGAAATAQRPALEVGTAPSALSDLKESAADILAAALAKGGSGLTFEIVQRSTISARPGGPKIPVPDAVDPHETVAMADTYFLNAVIERGIATVDGFYSEIRVGPAPGDKPDWSGDIRRQALARDERVFRNDGDGWYRTDNPPGVGLDPASVLLLPALVRNAAAPADAGIDPTNASLRLITATGTVADAPGVVTADGRDFTVLRGPATFAFDPDGRVTRVLLVALNTNMDEFDLVVETEITLRYAVSEALPAAAPLLQDTKAVVKP